MSLVEYIQEHIPEPRQTKVLKLLSAWMGIGDHVTPALEKTPKYKAAIQGAMNLMRNTGFDWIEEGDTVQVIGERWAKLFCKESHSVAFGMRFSTTVPLVVTFGFLKHSGERRIYIQWIRYSFCENGLFQPQNLSRKMDFVGALLYGLQQLNVRHNQLQSLKRLDLNRYKAVQQMLNGYARSNLTKTERWEELDEEQNKRIGYCSE